MQIEKRLDIVARQLKLSVNTFKNSVLYPMMEIQTKRNIDCGIVRLSNKKRSTYLFNMEVFLKSLNLLNEVDACYTKEEKSTILTSAIKEKDIEKRLTRLLTTKQ